MDSSGTFTGSEAESLSYFFSVKKDILVVTLNGAIDKGAIEVLQKCVAEVPAEDVAYAILNLAGVQEVDRAGASEFIRLQKAFRSRPAKLTICSMSIATQEALKSYGALRPTEVARDLVEALQSHVS